MVETMAFPQPPRDPLRVPVTALRWTRYALARDTKEEWQEELRLKKIRKKLKAFGFSNSQIDDFINQNAHQLFPDGEKM